MCEARRHPTHPNAATGRYFEERWDTCIFHKCSRESEEDQDFITASLLLSKQAVAQMEEPEYNQSSEGRSPRKEVGNQAPVLTLSVLPVTSLSFSFLIINMSSSGLSFSLMCWTTLW